MLVDVHAHIGPVTATGGSPATLATYGRDCGFDAVLISDPGTTRLAEPDTTPEAREREHFPPAALPRDEADTNRAVLDACSRCPPLRALYYSHPGRWDSNVHVLRGALASAPFVGTAFSGTPEALELAGQMLTASFDVLAAVSRPAVFYVRSAERSVAARIYEEARRHPNVPVVLCTCGGTEARAAILDVALRAARSEDADLYVDTSHANAAEVDAAIEALGLERVLFGSDAPDPGDGHAVRVAATLQELRTLLPADEFQQICGDNATRLFNLQGAAG